MQEQACDGVAGFWKWQVIWHLIRGVRQTMRSVEDQEGRCVFAGVRGLHSGVVLAHRSAGGKWLSLEPPAGTIGETQ